MVLFNVIVGSLLSLPIWTLFILVRTALMLVGHVLIPVAVLFKAYEVRPSKFYDKQILSWTWKIMYLWGNEEDGIGGSPNYPFNGEMWSLNRKIWTWSAVRNPVNNLRFVPILSFKLNPEKIKWYGNQLNLHLHNTTEHYYFAHQGAYSCLLIMYRSKSGELKRFWLGWKIRPSAKINGVSPYQVPGVGFSTQITTRR